MILGNLINQACMVIWIRSAVLGFDPHGDVVQSDNLRLLELLDEAMARGVVQGCAVDISLERLLTLSQITPSDDLGGGHRLPCTSAPGR